MTQKWKSYEYLRWLFGSQTFIWRVDGTDVVVGFSATITWTDFPPGKRQFILSGRNLPICNGANRLQAAAGGGVIKAVNGESGFRWSLVPNAPDPPGTTICIA